MRALREAGGVWRTCHVHLLHHGDISIWLWSADGEPDEPQAPPLVHRAQWPGPILRLLASAVCPQLSQLVSWLEIPNSGRGVGAGEGLQLISQRANSRINEQLSDKKFNKEIDKGHIQMAHRKKYKWFSNIWKNVQSNKEKGKYKLYQLYLFSIAVWHTATNLAAYNNANALFLQFSGPIVWPRSLQAEIKVLTGLCLFL